MGDVEVTVTYTYVDSPTVENPYTVDMEVHRQSGRIFMGNACLCKGVHRVYWTPSGEPLKLSNFVIKSKAAQVELLEAPTNIPSTERWTALIENKGVTDINGIKYTFDCQPPANFTHDPTIAVTDDPPPEGYSPLATESGAREAVLGA